MKKILSLLLVITVILPIFTSFVGAADEGTTAPAAAEERTEPISNPEDLEIPNTEEVTGTLPPVNPPPAEETTQPPTEIPPVVDPTTPPQNIPTPEIPTQIVETDETAFGIYYDEYSIDDIIIPGKIDGVESNEFYINLTRETITFPQGYTVAAYSINGGTSWTANSRSTFNSAEFVKLLTKDLTLAITDKIEGGGSKRKPSANATVVEFPKINQRPKVTDLVINYAIGSDPTGQTTGTWVLSKKNSSDSVKEGIDIALSDSAGRNPNKDGYGRFYGENGSTNGIPVVELPSDNREVKTSYFYRNSAKANDNGTYTAASLNKKITAEGQSKPSNYSVNKRNKTISYNANTYVFTYNHTEPELKKFKGTLNVSDYDGDVYLWSAASATSPASAMQKTIVTPGAKDISNVNTTVRSVPAVINAPAVPEAAPIAAPTTQAPTTAAPTTQAPTAPPTTSAPTQPATQPPTQPPTQAPTAAPTVQPATQAPITAAPTTENVKKEIDSLFEPTTKAPTTQAPTTQAPTTAAPAAQTPRTSDQNTQSITPQSIEITPYAGGVNDWTLTPSGPLQIKVGDSVTLTVYAPDPLVNVFTWSMIGIGVVTYTESTYDIASIGYTTNKITGIKEGNVTITVTAIGYDPNFKEIEIEVLPADSTAFIPPPAPVIVPRTLPDAEIEVQYPPTGETSTIDVIRDPRISLIRWICTGGVAGDSTTEVTLVIPAVGDLTDKYQIGTSGLYFQGGAITGNAINDGIYSFLLMLEYSYVDDKGDTKKSFSGAVSFTIKIWQRYKVLIDVEPNEGGKLIAENKKGNEVIDSREAPPSVELVVEKNNSVSFTAKPNPGYVVEKWVVTKNYNDPDPLPNPLPDPLPESVWEKGKPKNIDEDGSPGDKVYSIPGLKGDVTVKVVFKPSPSVFIPAVPDNIERKVKEPFTSHPLEVFSVVDVPFDDWDFVSVTCDGEEIDLTTDNPFDIDSVTTYDNTTKIVTANLIWVKNGNNIPQKNVDAGYYVIKITAGDSQVKIINLRIWDKFDINFRVISPPPNIEENPPTFSTLTVSVPRSSGTESATSPGGITGYITIFDILENTKDITFTANPRNGYDPYWYIINDFKAYSNNTQPSLSPANDGTPSTLTTALIKAKDNINFENSSPGRFEDYATLLKYVIEDGIKTNITVLVWFKTAEPYYVYFGDGYSDGTKFVRSPDGNVKLTSLAGITQNPSLGILNVPIKYTDLPVGFTAFPITPGYRTVEWTVWVHEDDTIIGETKNPTINTNKYPGITAGAWGTAITMPTENLHQAPVGKYYRLPNAGKLGGNDFELLTLRSNVLVLAEFGNELTDAIVESVRLKTGGKVSSQTSTTVPPYKYNLTIGAGGNYKLEAEVRPPQVNQDVIWAFKEVIFSANMAKAYTPTSGVSTIASDVRVNPDNPQEVQFMTKTTTTSGGVSTTTSSNWMTLATVDSTGNVHVAREFETYFNLSDEKPDYLQLTVRAMAAADTDLDKSAFCDLLITRYIPVSSLDLQPSDKTTLIVGQTYNDLKVTVLPIATAPYFDNGASNTNYTWAWTVPNQTIAHYDDENGIITGLSVGTAVIRFTTEGLGASGQPIYQDFTITVTEPLITANPATLDFGTIQQGYASAPAAQTITVTNMGTMRTGPLTVTLLGDNKNDFTVNPTSISDINFVPGQNTYDLKVRPKAGLTEGIYQAIVRVGNDTVGYREVTLKFEVTDPNAPPTPPTPTLTLNPTSASIVVSGNCDITGTVQNRPSGATESWSWSASPSGIVTLSGSGNTVRVTGTATGTATITATLKLSSGHTLTATARVTVTIRPTIIRPQELTDGPFPSKEVGGSYSQLYLPNATMNKQYNETLLTKGFENEIGVTPHLYWRIVGGTLPPGLQLTQWVDESTRIGTGAINEGVSRSSAVIEGKPTELGVGKLYTIILEANELILYERANVVIWSKESFNPVSRAEAEAAAKVAQTDRDNADKADADSARAESLAKNARDKAEADRDAATAAENAIPSPPTLAALVAKAVESEKAADKAEADAAVAKKTAERAEERAQKSEDTAAKLAAAAKSAEEIETIRWGNSRVLLSGKKATRTINIFVEPSIYIPVTGVVIYSSTTEAPSTADTAPAQPNAVVTVPLNGSVQLNANVFPPRATNKNITWTTSNPTVATVDQLGNVYGHSEGTAIIEVITADGAHKTSRTVKVQRIAITGVTLNKTAINLPVGGTDTLTAIVKPDTASDKIVTYNSNDINTVTVDEHGVIRAIAAGRAIITVTSGGQNATCTVTVQAKPPVPATAISLNKTVTTLKIGESEILSATVLPANTTDKSVTWSSNRPDIVSVDPVTGVITARTIPNMNETIRNPKYNNLQNIPNPNYDDRNEIANPMYDPNKTNPDTNTPNEKYDPRSTILNPNYDPRPTIPNPSYDPRDTIPKTNPNYDPRPTIIVNNTKYDPNEYISNTKYNLNYDKPATYDDREFLINPNYDDRETITITNPNYDPRFYLDTILVVITATVSGTTIKADCTVDVEPDVPANRIELNKDVTTIPIDKTEMLAATIYPINATGQTLTWRSQDPNIATVDSKGNVTGKSIGVTVIEVGTASGFSATCTISVILIESDFTTSIGVSRFVDVNPNEWYAPYIEQAAEYGLIQGKPENRFDPETSVTRAEFVTMIVRALDLTVTQGTSRYGDVAGDWYTDIITTADRRGLLAKFTDVNFYPNRIITREEMAVILAAAARHVGIGYVPTFNKPLSEIFDDYLLITQGQQAYNEDVKLIYDLEIMNGKPGSGALGLEFEPQGRATRAEAATVMVRLYHTLLRGSTPG